MRFYCTSTGPIGGLSCEVPIANIIPTMLNGKTDIVEFTVGETCLVQMFG